MEPYPKESFLGLADPVSAATHMAAAAASVWALVPLWRGTASCPWKRATVTAFGVSLVLLFAASATYHALPFGPLRDVFRRLDHASIYFHIAATFTAVAGNLMRGGWRVFTIAAIWVIAGAGMVFKLAFFGAASEAVDTGLFLATGWFGCLPFVAVVRTVGVASTWPIVLGAIFHTGGAVAELYGWPRLWSRVFSFHEVYHLLVVAASACFFVFVLRHVARDPRS